MCKMLARASGESGVLNVFADTHSQEILFSGSWAECKAYILENGYGKQIVAKTQQSVGKEFDRRAAMVALQIIHSARKNSAEYKKAMKSLVDLIELS